SIADVTLSNPNDAGAFSRPEMLRVARVELSIPLLSLLQHRFEINHVSLIRPDLTLEIGKGGARNWVFARGPAPTGNGLAPSDAAGPPAERATANRFAVAFTDIDLQGGRVTWRDDASGRSVTADIPRLTVTVPPSGGMQATGQMLWDGHT